jgi:hypothetical protein
MESEITYGLRVREEAIEAPVEDAGGDEGVNVADCEPGRVKVVSVALSTKSRRDMIRH